ncbi:hypothetical protein N2152v2_007687 [Parachlorella kessleri]
MFKKLFGGSEKGGGSTSSSKPVQVTQRSTATTVDAIQKLGETEELLIKKRDLLERKIAQELDRAKEFTKQKNKRAALAALKKKKLYETQLEQIENNILRVGEQQTMLENQRATVLTVGALQEAALASKATMQEMKIENVDKVLDDINDHADQMRQITDAMSQPLGAAADIDEDELLGELEDMEAQEMEASLLEPAPVPTTKVPQAAQALPAVPARPQTAKPAKTAEELELEQLQAELAM